MQSFVPVTKYAITYESSGRWRTLAAPVYFLYRGITFCIPAGFRWNGASVPWLLWWWVSPWTRWVVLASCVHDWLYGNKRLPRRDADRIFLQLLLIEARRCRWRWRRYHLTVRARIMYQAVRQFGDLVAGADW